MPVMSDMTYYVSCGTLNLSSHSNLWENMQLNWLDSLKFKFFLSSVHVDLLSSLSAQDGPKSFIEGWHIFKIHSLLQSAVNLLQHVCLARLSHKISMSGWSWPRNFFLFDSTSVKLLIFFTAVLFWLFNFSCIFVAQCTCTKWQFANFFKFW